MRVIIAPDSFKESLSSPEAAAAIRTGWLRGAPDSTCHVVPLADGGEGTVAALVAATGGRLVSHEVSGPLGDRVSADLGVLGGEGTLTAVVEVAAATGLAHVPETRRDAARATSYGTGELVAAALDLGARRIILGLGGSASTDGGAGMLRALGVRLLDDAGDEVIGGGGDLDRITRIETDGLHPGLTGCEVVAACDVDNPLTGPQGAAAIYGPQKGANAATVAVLDRHLGHFAAVLAASGCTADPETPGAGAAGGIGFAVLAVMGGSLRPGFDIVAEAVHLDALLEGADLVVTGEGSLDAQSLSGKTPVGVMRRAHERGIPVIALAGSLGDGVEDLLAAGMTAVFSVVPGLVSRAEAMEDAAANLQRTAEAVGAVWAAACHPRPPARG